MNPEIVLKRLQDIFPTFKHAIGGSFARNKILGLPVEAGSDVDFYTTVPITRYMFKDILENVILPGQDFVYTSIEPEGNYRKYNMPHLRKKISISFLDGDIPDMDFIFVAHEHVKNIADYLLKYQASTISECCLQIDSWVSTEYTAKHSHRFKQSCIEKEVAVLLNNHPEVCTPEQMRKIAKFCEANRLELRSTSRPYEY